MKRLFVISLLLVLSLTLIAARPLQEAPSGDVLLYLQLAIAAFTALIGWPALLSVIVVALQYFGRLSNTAAEQFLFWANVLGFGAVFVLALLGKIDLVNQIDATLGTLAKLLTYVLILLGAPMAFERAVVTQDRLRATRFFQARVLAQVK